MACSTSLLRKQPDGRWFFRFARVDLPRRAQMLNRTNRVLAVVLFAAIVVWTGVSVRTGPSDRRGLKPRDKAGEMSDIGRAAAKTRKAIARVAVASAKDPEATGSCLNEPDC